MTISQSTHFRHLKTTSKTNYYRSTWSDRLNSLNVYIWEISDLICDETLRGKIEEY
jgi:hypothetical protein